MAGAHYIHGIPPTSMECPLNALLRLPAVISATGLARPTVYLRIKNGLFPNSVKLSDRAVAWPSDEVQAVINARIAGKSDDEIRNLVAALEQRRSARA